MSIKDTLKERGTTHGDFGVNSRISQQLKHASRGACGYVRLLPNHMEALDMIAHKISRMIAGDPTFADHPHDIGGYSGLNIIDNGVTLPEITTDTIMQVNNLTRQYEMILEGEEGYDRLSPVQKLELGNILAAMASIICVKATYSPYWLMIQEASIEMEKSLSTPEPLHKD